MNSSCPEWAQGIREVWDRAPQLDLWLSVIDIAQYPSMITSPQWYTDCMFNAFRRVRENRGSLWRGSCKHGTLYFPIHRHPHTIAGYEDFTVGGLEWRALKQLALVEVRRENSFRKGSDEWVNFMSERTSCNFLYILNILCNLQAVNPGWVWEESVVTIRVERNFWLSSERYKQTERERKGRISRGRGRAFNPYRSGKGWEASI